MRYKTYCNDSIDRRNENHDLLCAEIYIVMFPKIVDNVFFADSDSICVECLL